MPMGAEMPLRDTLKSLRRATQQAVDPVAAVARWRDAVDDLYGVVRQHLKEYVANNLILLQKVRVTKSEDQLGSYEIHELHLIAGPAAIILSPIGTQVIGAHGRIDMYRRGYASNRYLLLWKGNVKGAPGWQLVHPGDQTDPKPYTKERFEEILDTLLRQS